MDNTFQKSNNIGKIGENYFQDIEAYEKFGNDFTILRVTEDKRFQNLGVDFIAIEKEATVDEIFDSFTDDNEWKPYSYLIEVKTDQHVISTNNIVYEVMSSSEKLGCTEATIADEIYYYGVDENLSIIKGWSINPVKLRQWFRYNMLFSHGKEKKEKILSNRPSSNGRVFFCLNINALITDGVAKEIPILKENWRGYNLIQRFISNSTD